MSNLEYDYGCFSKLINNEKLVINTSDINLENINDYQNNLSDLFLDYIETDTLQKSKVTFVFDNSMKVNLNASYALINIMIWSCIIKTGQKIQPCHVFYRKRGITNSYIKEYLDRFPIIYTRDKMNRENDKMLIMNLNRVIYDTLRSLKFVDRFAWYFNNSINNEDFILMYYNCPGFKEIIDRHNTNYYSSLPVDRMNSEALADMNKLVDYIVDAKRYIGRDHCLSNAFRAQVGVKPKQAREMYVNIGIKPNGEGGVFPYIANTSYISGGANNVAYHILESLVARIAQILSKKNTASSGAFSRNMNLNCSTSRKYTIPGTDNLDPGYDCHTQNFIMYNVKDKTALHKIADRYYRLDPHGIEYKTDNAYNICKTNADLIGRVIYLRSPIKCRSAALGLGICRKCMGELYSIMNTINIGVYSVTRLTEPLTQMMLSAKHLLEAKISEVMLTSCNKENIADYVYIEDGTVMINQNIDTPNKWRVFINEDDIETEVMATTYDGDDSYEDSYDLEDITKYVKVFYLTNTSTGESIEIRTNDSHNLYLTEYLASYIDSVGFDNGSISIPVSEFIEDDSASLFNVGIYNDDMTARLKGVIDIINLKSNTDSYTAETFLESLSEKLNDIGLDHIMLFHLEVLIMNQIRDGDDILEMPDWDIPNNNNYQVLTMKKSLETNPSIAISLQGDNNASQLYSPLSFRKSKPSAYDLIYHVQPQRYIKSEPQIESEDIFHYITD